VAKNPPPAKKLPPSKRKPHPNGNGAEPSTLQPLRWFETSDSDRISLNYDGDLLRDHRIVHIYGPVGQSYYEDGYQHVVTSLEVSERIIRLVQVSKAPIQALINCSGGEVADGLAILDAFDMARQNGVKVVTRCQGQAQSMGADILILGGDWRTMSHNSFIMTHGDVDKTLRFGDGLDLKAEERIRSITQSRLMDLYAQKTKLPRSYWKDQMQDSRPVYWSPAEALAAGLVDEVF